MSLGMNIVVSQRFGGLVDTLPRHIDFPGVGWDDSVLAGS